MKEIRENPASSNVMLASFDYDDLGRRTLLTRGNGTSTSYDYTPSGTPGYDLSRLQTLSQTFPANSAYDLSQVFDYNKAGQIVSNSHSNDTYAWAVQGNGTTTTTPNGLNQIAARAAGGVTTQPTYDARGNMTSDGVKSFGYNSLNQLTGAPGSIHSYVYYEPLGRLSFIFDPVAGSKIMDYAGTELIAETEGAGSVLRRYVHGPNMDEPLVWYEGAGTSDPRYLHADERGSIVAVSDYAGTVIGVNKYDEYGMPQGPAGKGTLLGRFGYTG